jgi:hypothetical protein
LPRTALSAKRATVSALDLSELLPSWELSLRAERKSPATVKVYDTAQRGDHGSARAALERSSNTRLIRTAFSRRTSEPSAVVTPAPRTSRVGPALRAGPSPSSCRVRRVTVASMISATQADARTGDRTHGYDV